MKKMHSHTALFVPGLECPDHAQREQERALSSNTVKKTYLSWFPGGEGSSVIADGVCKR